MEEGRGAKTSSCSYTADDSIRDRRTTKGTQNRNCKEHVVSENKNEKRAAKLNN